MGGEVLPKKPQIAEELEDYLNDLKEIADKLEVSHLPAEGVPEDSAEFGVPFNHALSCLEGSKVLVEQAIKDIKKALAAL